MIIYYLLTLLFAGVNFCNAAQQAPTVHVLLQKWENAREGMTWNIQGTSGFILRDPYQLDHYDQLGGATCHLSFKRGNLWANKKKLAHQRIMIEPQEDVLCYNNKQYAGTLSLIHEEGVWYLINSVDLEDYVCSVLRSESWPGWPLEVNKAFAIMQRSYVMAKVLQARTKRKKGKRLVYDIGCTNKDQTYQGIHDSAILRQAVDETKGIVLAYEKKPIIAMYDTCCGGLIPAKMKDVNFKEAPYLARAYPCTFCTNCKVYNWKVTYSLSHCEELCHKAGLPIKNLQELRITKHDKAGIVQEVQLRAGKKWHTITGKKMYNICKDIKSYCFSVSHQAKSITFSGKGYGHHLGLCQWGARQMVDEGWNYKEILTFYYPNTTFMRIELSKNLL